jgi:hypothetical protein
MKTAIGAVQGMSTCKLLDLADFVWNTEKSSRQTAQGAVRNPQNGQLAEAAEQVQRQQRRPLQDGGVQTSGLQAEMIPSVRRIGRSGGFLRGIWARLTGLFKENGRVVSNIQSTANSNSESAPRTEQPAQAQSALPAGAVESVGTDREEIQKSNPKVNLRNLNRHVRNIVGETIIGRVTIEMVLAELERRGYPYRPPIREDGTLVIRQCDLTNQVVDGFRKVRPGIERIIREARCQSIKITALTPVRIGSPIANEHLQFESSTAVSLPALNVKAIFAPHLRVDGTVEAANLGVQKAECQELKAEVIEGDNLRVERDANVMHLNVKGDVSIGGALNGTLSIRVGGNARIGTLGDDIPATCKVDGASILEVFRERTGRTRPNEDLRPRQGVAGSADHRIEKAFNILRSQNQPISASRLAALSSTNYHTAKRWLERERQNADGQWESEQTDIAKRIPSVRCRP